MDTAENLRPFFEEYAQANDQNDLTSIAGFYADSFMAAGPKGSVTFTNDQHFVEWLRQLQEFNKQTGMKQMQIVNFEQTSISDDYQAAIITWGAKFPKTGDELITFDITYFLNVKQTTPKIIMYVSHSDQEDLMREKGLL